MKKLLELLGIVLLTGNAVGPLATNKSNNKAKIKNSPETLTRPKRQAPKGGKGKNNKKVNPTKSSATLPKNEQVGNSSVNTVDQVDFIEKEITLDGTYADNIQKLLKDFMKNNQIDPFRMINNEGIVTTDYYETDKRKKEREDNLQIIKELDQILGLSKFDANKIRILILTLKNSEENKEIKLVINLDNLYLQGFINKNNQYFYFKEEKSFKQWNQEKNKIEDQLNEWKILEGNFNSLSLNDEIKNKIKEIDKFKDESKRKLNQENSEENKKIIRHIQNNSFTEIEKSCQDDEIKQKILKLKPFWNIYQKIQQIRQKALNLLKKMNVKPEDKKAYEEFIKEIK